MLNKDFMPAYMWVKEFMKEADEPFTIAVERENGIVENYETKINTNDTEKSKFYIERTVKTLLWFYGGFKIYLSGQNEICEHIKQCYSKGVGLNMITYLGALQNVPTELDEAAQIDGANKWQRIKNVVIPMISPTTFFLIISSIITSLQNFTVIQSLTEGGPGQSTTVMALSIVRTAFVQNNTAFASAQAMVIFLIVMIITLIQWRGQKKWVNY